jgi:hypothetical protein
MWTSVRQTICALVLVLGSASAFASEIDYEHGKAQVKQLLIDRPLFRFYRDSKNKIKELKATDAPYIWAVRQFGGGCDRRAGCMDAAGTRGGALRLRWAMEVCTRVHSDRLWS